MKNLPSPGLERNGPRQGGYALRHGSTECVERNGVSNKQRENGEIGVLKLPKCRFVRTSPEDRFSS